MKLSCASAYAVSALVSMAGQKEPGNILASHLTARAKGIPEKMLLKVLGSLARAGLLQSRKGPNGGYRLARPAARITLLEIIEAVDGPISEQVPGFLVESLNGSTGAEGPALLNEKAAGKLQEVFGHVAEQTRKHLGKVRLAELLGGAERKKAPRPRSTRSSKG